MVDNTETTARDSEGHAYRSIREQILSGELPGGGWLREEDLAAALGVSRTPVREAFRRLAVEGLVHHQRNRGVQVREWSLRDLDEIFSLRTELEPWGCGLAAASGRVDVAELAELAAAMDTAAAGRQPNIDQITDLNNRFHRIIRDAAGNSRLAAILTSLVQVPLVWRTFACCDGAWRTITRSSPPYRHKTPCGPSP